eukprot:g30284.t1
MRAVSCLLLSGSVAAELTFQVSHSYTKTEAKVVWTPLQSHPKGHSGAPSFRQSLDVEEDGDLRILHITDTWTDGLFLVPSTWRSMLWKYYITDTKRPCDQLVSLFQKAKELNVDLIALGGDIINYPSETEVAWVLQQLQDAAGGIPFLMFGQHRVKGVDILWIDNSNYQITPEQLAFAEKQLSQSAQAGPVVLMLHIPLALPGVDLPPKDGGVVSMRANEPSTNAFLELVQKHSAPHGRITALLTGHVHQDFTTGLPPPKVKLGRRGDVAPSNLASTKAWCRGDVPATGVSALRSLVLSILGTLKVLLWSVLLLFMILYVFGIVFTDVSNEYSGQNQLEEISTESIDFLQQHFYDLERTMQTLFQSICNGNSWGVVADNLNKISRLWGSFGPKIGPIRTCRVSGKGHDQVQHDTCISPMWPSVCLPF